MSYNTFGILWNEVDRPGLGTKVFAGAIDPDVHTLNLVRRHSKFHVP